MTEPSRYYRKEWQLRWPLPDGGRGDKRRLARYEEPRIHAGLWMSCDCITEQLTFIRLAIPRYLKWLGCRL